MKSIIRSDPLKADGPAKIHFIQKTVPLKYSTQTYRVLYIYIHIYNIMYYIIHIENFYLYLSLHIFIIIYKESII